MATSTVSWINTVFSIERVFREMDKLSDCTILNKDLPDDIGTQRAFCNSDDPHVLFLAITPGDIDRIQDTYVKLTLCEDRTLQQNYLPVQNLHGTWLREKAMYIQQVLNRGDAGHANLFPLYDYLNLVPVSTYDAFLLDGDTSQVGTFLTGTPVKIERTGFVVRAGHSRPEFNFAQNPMKVQWTTVWEHWSYDVWCAQRG